MDYSQANGMIFILEQVHIISIYFSVFVHMIPKWRLVPIQLTPARMSSFQFSIWMKFSFWYEVSFWYHVNWKRTLFQIENHQSCSLGARSKYASDLVWKPHEWECLRLSHSILSWECSTNLTLERNSFWNESHSGIN